MELTQLKTMITKKINENRLVYHLSQGKSIKECADIFNVGFRQMGNYIDRMRKKKKAINRTHLVVKFLFDQYESN
jgi:DNA-binding CsgD family transcriptional regulator